MKGLINENEEKSSEEEYILNLWSHLEEEQKEEVDKANKKDANQ